MAYIQNRKIVRTTDQSKLSNINFRLRRIQSREGANLEYLKNVVMAYLMSTDYAGRKHMLNAIAAVLHFTPNEKSLVSSNL